MDKVKVFVYGTLRKGEGNDHLLKQATCIGEQCWTNGQLFDTGYGFPAMKQTESSRVYGELYKVTEDELRRLDQLEGYAAGERNNFYERIVQPVFTDQGEEFAYMYVAGQSHLLKRQIPNGDWKEFKLFSRSHSDTVLYFAYGSCMDEKRIYEAGYAHYFQQMVGVGVLTNYALKFTRQSTVDGMGRADIVEGGGRVEGKVYNIPISALKEYLYAREGVPFAYRPAFVTLALNGEAVQALTFVVTEKKEEMPPPHWYEEEIVRGAEGHVSAQYLSEVKRHMNTLKKSQLSIISAKRTPSSKIR